jgi:hypothetical protein
VLAVAGLLVAPAPEAAPQHDGVGMHVGNPHPYPDLGKAKPAGRRRARRVHRAVRVAARRLDSLAEAARRGYVANPLVSPIRRPGLTHYRRNGTRAWGGLLDPRRPQALIFWCPTAGECSLAAFVFRARPRTRPPLLGGILGWHRHARHGSWMTHAWLTHRARTAFAQCAPIAHLQAYNAAIVPEPFLPDVPEVDAPCPDTPVH